MKITVLAGGCSPEREVSLSSGSLIANALMENGHKVFLLDVYEGIPELPRDPETLFQTFGHYTHPITETVPDLEALRERTGNGRALIGKNVEAVCRMSDAVFLALHGAMGENGQMQAFLECLGIPHTGSDYAGCLLAMDKDLSKRMFRLSGIPTPEWILFDTVHDDEKKILEQIGLPCVVKPLDCGSSVGVSIVEDLPALKSALAEAARYGSRVLVEQKITGRELTMGYLDGRALPPVEIIPKEGFYDYKNKYQGSTEEVCPAQIPEEVAKKMAELTVCGFAALRLRGYARFDYLLDRDNQLWCLEANTLPGMTPTSLLPQEANAVGISYNALCDVILELAFR